MHDILIGLQYGDEGKGKATKYLIENGSYTHCVRFNGGPNAGHTIFHQGKKIVTHQIPTGIFHGLISIIGPGCVVDLRKLQLEIYAIKELGIDVDKLLKLSYNCHIISKDHIEEDINKDKIGSTRCGITPVYVDKYRKSGLRACDISDICVDVIDPSVELNKPGVKVFFEGAQGFMLDIDWGNYPYVTSSSCLSYNACSSGVSLKSIDKIYGVAKIYRTYVGNFDFQPDDENLDKIAVLGSELGATTGRRRQCNWLDLPQLQKSVMINGVTDLIINKCDIISKLGVFKLYNGDLIEFNTFKEMKEYINSFLNIKVTYSGSLVVV